MTALNTDGVKLAHTAGPWFVGRGADGFPIIASAPDSFSPSGQGIAHVCKRPMTQDHEANARLISAAPDLLEALKHARANMPHPDQMIDAAIAKADGRTP